MATLDIPTLAGSVAPDYTQRTSLDGRDFILRFLWNQREGRWHLYLHDAGNVLLATVKLVCDVNLLLAAQWDARVPQGPLRVMSLNQDQSPPGLDDLAEGERCSLVYTTTIEQ